MMSDDTKMIIITSNSEIIQQFQTNENLQTQIIDLDDGDDQNRFNLAFLAQLFNPLVCFFKIRLKLTKNKLLELPK